MCRARTIFILKIEVLTKCKKMLFVYVKKIYLFLVR